MSMTARRPDYRLEALQHEARRDLPAALDAWQMALSEAPESLEIARHLADLAFRLNMWEMAEKLLAHLIVKGARDVSTVTAYAATLREQSRYDEAIELLKSQLDASPEVSALWEGLGSALAAKGDTETAYIFLSEALRLDPDNLHARFNRACTLIEMGQVSEGLADSQTCAAGFCDADNRISAELVSAHAALILGDLSQGWAGFASRHKVGTQSEVHYETGLPKLTSWDSLAGLRLFVSAEQGLGDEVLFGTLLNDIAARLGPDGKLGIGVEPRLVSLFVRSFPDADVVAHRTRTLEGRRVRDFPDMPTGTYQAYALMGDALPTLRSDIADFGGKPAYLVPCPLRQNHWRATLERMGPGRKVGILWKSLKGGANRDRYFASFDQWSSLLTVPGVQFISLQYGDTKAELEVAASAGLTLTQPEGIDLKDDLDDVAALCSVLDIVIGPSNATTNIAAACGTDTWLLGVHPSWHMLGSDTYPWYPKVRYFAAPRLGDWVPALQDMRRALTA